MQLDGLFKADDGAALRFYVEAQKNPFQSERAGAPVYDECLMVEVITPGSKESSPVFECERKFNKASNIPDPVRSVHYDKYKAQIEAFRSKSDDADMRGTPLDAWPALDVSTRAALFDMRVYTIDALAAVDEQKLRSMRNTLGPDCITLKERAAAFLSAASSNADGEGMAAEVARLTAEVARITAEKQALDAQVTALNAQLSAVTGTPAPVVVQPPVSLAPLI